MHGPIEAQAGESVLELLISKLGTSKPLSLSIRFVGDGSVRRATRNDGEQIQGDERRVGSV